MDLHWSLNVPGPVIHSTEVVKRSDRGYAEENGSSEYSILRYINQVLMEDDLEDEDCAIEDSTLHAVEQSFYETRNKNDHSSPNQRLPHEDASSRTDDHFTHSCNNYSTSCISTSNSVESVGLLSDLHGYNFSHTHCPHVKNALLTNSDSFCLPSCSSNTAPESQSDRGFNGGRVGKVKAKPEKDGRDLPDCLLRGRKTEGSDYLEEGRSKRHLAVYNEEIVLSEMFSKVLSLYDITEHSVLGTHDGALPNGDYSKRNELANVSNGERTTRSKKGVRKRKAIDMRSLLIQCMESVAGYDHSTASKQLSHIRSLCSPMGDGSQRLAHYFANSLEARLFGFEKQKCEFAFGRSDEDILKTHKISHSQLPHMEASFFFANQVIAEVAEKARSLHIIQFGIMYGLQWPSLIRHLSKRPGGPPKLRITAIDLPKSGYLPCARVEETGQRLATYCERFNVPFEYNGFTQQWETVDVEDLRIEKDEVLVVYCLYQLMLLHDETIVEPSPRDAVLNLIKRINPEMFIHGVVHAPLNSPFFVSRFREALFYYYALFDMLEANFPRDNKERKVFERDILGNQIMNVVAREGVERVVRPETYKQWQVRTLRAGFRQLPLNQEMMMELRAKFKSSYHKDNFVDEASQWLLVGWQKRAMTAFSCWKPT